MIPLDSLIAKVSPDEYMAKLEAVLATLGVDTSKYRKGGVLRVLMRAQAMTFSGLTEIMVAVIKGGFLDLAEGPWLTLLARSVFGVDRRVAQAASGDVVFTNTGGGSFAAIDYPTGSVRIFSSRTKKKYFNAEPLALGPLSNVTVSVVALEVGSDSYASVGDVDSLETTLLGVEVTNLEALVGLEEDSDEDLRAACRAKVASISGLGPRGAYEWAVRQATRLDGTPTAINRVSVPEGSWTATVDVTLAGPSGAPIAGDVTAATASIESIARPSGVRVNVAAADEVVISRVATIWVLRSAAQAIGTIKTQAEKSILSGFATYALGGLKKPGDALGSLYADWIKGLCKVHPGVFDVDLSDESDVALPSDGVAKWAGSVIVRAA